MAGHTPKPWQISWQHDPSGYPVFSIHGFGGEEKRDQTTLDANARLIAAAPDLLEALIDLASDAKWQNAPDDILRNARAAIAKATGQP